MNYPEKCAIIFRESMGKSPVVEQHRKELFDKCTGDVRNALTAVSKNQGLTFKGAYSADVIAVSIMGIYERVANQYLFWQDATHDIKIIGRDAVAFIVGGVNNSFNETSFIPYDKD